MAINSRKFINELLYIVDKNAQLIRFSKLNRPQDKVYAAIADQHRRGLPIRIIVLKARQEGISTLSTALDSKTAMTVPNAKVGVLTHKADTTDNMNRMCKTHFMNLPEEFRERLEVGAFNDREISYRALNSSIKFYTAGAGDGVGVGETFNRLHVSELSRWQHAKETLLPILQTVPNTPDSMVIIESTARGFDYFKGMWDKAVSGESDFAPVFCAWWEMEEYTMEPPEDMVLTQEERELKITYSLTDGQLAWRRWAIKNNCDNDVRMFHQDYPSCPQEAFLSTGECVFDSASISMMMNELSRSEGERGAFEYTWRTVEHRDEIGRVVDVTREIDGYEWVPDEAGPIRIYEHPFNGGGMEKPYVMGCDTAGEGSDFWTACVIDNTNKTTVATYRKNRIDGDLYAEQMYCLARYYNDAYVAIENNFSVVPIRHLTKDLGYTNLYRTERIDTITNRPTIEYGWRTTKISKDAMIRGLVREFRENPRMERDRQTIVEMSTYVTDDRGSFNAMEGCHDDTVIASAIARFVSPNAPTEARRKVVDNSEWWRRNFGVEPIPDDEADGLMDAWEEF